MLSKSEKLWIKSLKNKQTRYLQNEFIAEGSRIVLDLIRAAPQKLKFLCATEEWYANFGPLLTNHTKKIRIISNQILQSVSSLKSTEEVLAIFSFPDSPATIKSDNRLIIYLEHIKDPGNLGTIIRSADWFGLQRIYCSPDSVDPFNNKCVQATMSSIMRVQVSAMTWEEMLEKYDTVDKYAAAADGESIYKLHQDDIQFICIGNEAHGLSPQIVKQCKMKVSIPSYNSLGAESLNASVACSLIMAWKTFGA